MSERTHIHWYAIAILLFLASTGFFTKPTPQCSVDVGAHLCPLDDTRNYAIFIPIVLVIHRIVRQNGVFFTAAPESGPTQHTGVSSGETPPSPQQAASHLPLLPPTHQPSPASGLLTITKNATKWPKAWRPELLSALLAHLLSPQQWETHSCPVSIDPSCNVNNSPS